MPYYKRGDTSLKRGQYKRAIVDLDEAIRLNPQYASAYVSRALAFILLGKDTEAEQDVDRAVELGADHGLLEEEIEELKKQR